MTRLRFIAVLVAVLVGGLVPNTSAAADDSSDIPGIPLPSSVVSGQLGGPIYDVVYRIDVPAGHVLLAGLTGSPGTDFDLYLYSPAATTVHSTSDVLVSSTGPTSTEQISWATRIPLTVYLDLNGASAVEGTYSLTVQVVPDPTPPQLALSPMGGRAVVNTTSLTLQVAAFDDLSGVADMSFSSDAVNWTPWEPYTQTKSWVLVAADGPQTIYARVANGVGLLSAVASTVVTLDTVAPTVVSRSPGADATVTVAKPTIRVAFSESIAPASWANMGLAVQASDGSIVGGSYGYDAATRTGSFIPSRDLAPGHTYIITVGQVTDVAGNLIAPTGSWAMTFMLPSSVALSVSPLVIVSGGSAVLSGRANVPAGESAELEFRSADSSTFTPVSSIAGGFALRILPPSNGWYRLAYAGSPTTMAAATSPIRSLVRRGVALLGPTPTSVRSAVAGRIVNIYAQLLPAKGPRDVSFAIYRWDAVRRAWTPYRTFVRTADSTGQALMRWTPSAGRWAWRASVAPSTLYANNATPFYRWLVSH